jgi:HD-like signal output (HDOD) protein
MEVQCFLPDDKEIQHRVCQIRDLPPLPKALQKLLEILHDEGTHVEELESIVKYDPSLSARVLRIANSTYYGYRGQVGTLARALMVLGFEQVKTICLCAMLVEFFSGKNLLEASERERLWKHAFATANIANEMAKKRPWVKKDEAYILGLLHDLGWLVMAIYFKDYYVSIKNFAELRKVPAWHIETEYGLTHTRIGKWLSVKWSLPEVFARVMEFHHAPENSPSFKSETKLIALADVLANSREHPEPAASDITLSYCRDLFITEDEWNDYQERLTGIWSNVDQLWDLLK